MIQQLFYTNYNLERLGLNVNSLAFQDIMLLIVVFLGIFVDIGL